MARAGRQLNLSGVFAAAVTPNRPGTLDIDYSALMDLLDFLACAQVTGICLLGSTGEFLNYSFADRQRSVYLGSKRSRVPMLVGVGHSTLTGALLIAGEAIAAGADGLLLMPPPFFPYGQAEIEEFYRVFARETGDAVPILLYNIPDVTSKIEPPTVKRLLDSGFFAGIKDSSGDWNYFEELLALRRQKAFALLAGHDRIAPRALRAGADGVISGCAAAVPELVMAIGRSSGNADTLNQHLEEFVAWVERFPAPVVVKRAVQLRGQRSGEFAVPFNVERATELDEFSRWFTAWWPGVIAAMAQA
jgi:dihydrodipicolinate synthase/N-acetylneuraminate lyase